ncbi:MAG: S9 family peptidase [Candidatus Zixiibacteriota bacterium]|jgi:dipeptidyl aminopeptidase/acylaminoacyl peptidase
MIRTLTTLALAAATLVPAANGYTIEQYLNIHGNYYGYWLPDDEILYSNKFTGVMQAWRTNAATGEPEQISFFPEGIDLAVAHPITGDVIVSADAGGNERDQLYLYDDAAGEFKPITDNPKVIYNFGDWSPGGRYVAVAANERDERYFDVYLYDLETGERRLLMEDDNYNYPLLFSPDGSRLLVYRAYGSRDEDLFLVDVESGETRHLTPHEGPLNVGATCWAADGWGFYYAHDEGRDFQSLAYYDLELGEYRWVKTPPGDVEEVVMSTDGRYLLWIVNEDGYSRPHLYDFTRRKERPVPELPAEGVISYPRFSPDNERILFGLSAATAPGNLYVWDIAGDTIEPVTEPDLAGIPAESFVDAELVYFSSHDGLMIPAFLYLPPGVSDDATTGVIVYAHGGPRVQERPNFASLFQYWLDAGYAVFAPNFRGSSGYGREFADADNGSKRMDAVRDVQEGWWYLAGRPWCDRFRIAIYGASYGGFMVLSQLTQEPYYWAAGVDVVGIANFVTFLENTGPWRVALREDEYGSLETDRDLLVGISPLTHINAIRSPLMVIHGANDPRVPVSEAEQVVEKARLILGEDKVLYLRYEDEGHGLAKLENRLDAYPKMVEFLEEAFEGREPLRERLTEQVEEEMQLRDAARDEAGADTSPPEE